MQPENTFTQFARYASLHVLGMLSLSLYILADTYFVANGLGADGLTALNLAIPVYSFISGAGQMLGVGGAIRYALAKGQGRQAEGDRVFTGAVCLAALLALLFFACGLAASGAITRLLGADAAVFQMTRTYLRMILLFAPLFMLNEVLISFVRNDGQPRLAMLAMAASSFSNILLDYVFIFPLGMGIFGAVLATGIAPLCSMAVLSLHWLRRRNQFHLVRGRVPLRLLASIVPVGFPSLVSSVSSGLVMLVFNLLILRLEGNVGVAAYGVVANLSLVVTALFNGVAQGAQPLLSRAYGRREAAQVKRLARYAGVSVLALSALLYGAIFLGSGPIARAFNSQRDGHMQALAVAGLKLYFTALFFASFNTVVSAFFTATGRPLPAQALSLLRGFLLILPLAFLLAALWGITGVWLAYPLTECAAALLGLPLFIRCQKSPVPPAGGA